MSITRTEPRLTQFRGIIRLSELPMRDRKIGLTDYAIRGACASTKRPAKFGPATTARTFGKLRTLSGEVKIMGGAFMKAAIHFISTANSGRQRRSRQQSNTRTPKCGR